MSRSNGLVYPENPSGLQSLDLVDPEPPGFTNRRSFLPSRRPLRDPLEPRPSPDTRQERDAVVEAFPWNHAPRYSLPDHDGIYGIHFRRRVMDMGIREVVFAARSPWQNPHVERLLG